MSDEPKQMLFCVSKLDLGDKLAFTVCWIYPRCCKCWHLFVNFTCVARDESIALQNQQFNFWVTVNLNIVLCPRWHWNFHTNWFWNWNEVHVKLIDLFKFNWIFWLLRFCSASSVRCRWAAWVRRFRSTRTTIRWNKRNWRRWPISFKVTSPWWRCWATDIETCKSSTICGRTKTPR